MKYISYDRTAGFFQNTLKTNLVPRVLSYPPYRARGRERERERERDRQRERERDPGKRLSRGSRTKLILREESFVSHFFVWFIRNVHVVTATAR